MMIHRLAIPATLVVLGVASVAASPSVSTPNALNLMRQSSQVSIVQDSRAQTVFRLTSTSGKVREQRASTITKQMGAGSSGAARLARFLSPSDVKGTAVLTVEQAARDDDIWLYLPALGKVRRLQAENKRDPYMGTDLSYGDVIGHAPEDWNHRVTGSAMIDGASCWIVESLPQNTTVASRSGYSRRVNWVRSDNAVMVRAELYDLQGALLKRITQRGITRVSQNPARWQAMLISAENLRTRHRTDVVLSGYQANIGLTADQFTPRALERGK
jgi:uncharacterized protein